MILGAEIGLLIYGLYVLVTGKYLLGKGRQIIGGKARFLGALCLLPIPTSFFASLILGFVYALLTDEIPNPWLGTVIELIILVLYVIVIYFLGKNFYNQQDAQQTQANEYQSDYGSYANLDSDQFGSDSYNSYSEETSDEYIASLGKQPSQNKILGMAPVEFTILGILVIGICVLGGVVGMDFLNHRAAAMVTVQPTATPVPTETPIPTNTPVVTSTPLPGWSQFKFANEKASIWLPSFYQGGDPVAYPEVVAMTIDTFLTDDFFVQDAKNMILDPDIAFFGFDTQPAEVIPFIYIVRETLPLYSEFRINGYLDTLLDQMDLDQNGTQLIERSITSLDHYDDVGVLTIQSLVPVNEAASIYVKTAIHIIKVDDDVWAIMFRIGGEEFDSYFPTIQNSVRSFYVEPQS